MSAYNKLYNTSAWRKLRAKQLSNQPTCVRCHELGRTTQATVADHIVRHSGNEDLFYDPDNLQSLCTTCHNSYKRRLEVSGRVAGCTIDGLPLDKNHHWRKQQ